MIWVGVIILTIIGIFYTRISIFVDRTSDPNFSEDKTDKTDDLDGFVQPSTTESPNLIESSIE